MIFLEFVNRIVKKNHPEFIVSVLLCLTALILYSPIARASGQPNIVVLIADDMGWRDTGYNGHPFNKTPVLDEIASRGMRFDYFYTAGQMCCPGRYAILTGRAPMRGGINRLEEVWPNEITLARALKQAGYKSGYFGKWHLGRGPTGPIGMGYDEAIWIMNHFDLDPEFEINDSGQKLQKKGDGSLAVAELASEYIEKQVKLQKPFFVTIGFGSPHDPYQAAPEFRALYKNEKMNPDFAGEISGLDAATGNLRKTLRRLGIAENTLVWFVSDNGGVRLSSKDPAGKGKRNVAARTIALLEWPGRIQSPLRVTVPCGQVDIYPTVLDVVGLKIPNQPVLDGISLLPLLEGKMTTRPQPLGFMLFEYGSGKFPRLDFVKDSQGTWIDGNYELTVEPAGYKGKDPVKLFHIYQDPEQKRNLAPQLPQVLSKMRAALEEWQRSVRKSYDEQGYRKKK